MTEILKRDKDKNENHQCVHLKIIWDINHWHDDKHSLAINRIALVKQGKFFSGYGL